MAAYASNQIHVSVGQGGRVVCARSSTVAQPVSNPRATVLDQTSVLVIMDGMEHSVKNVCIPTAQKYTCLLYITLTHLLT